MLETARSLHLTRPQLVRKVLLPALAPGMFPGVRLGAPIALVVTLLVEFLTQADGVGGLIVTAQRSYLSADVWGLILLAGLFSLSFDSLVAWLEGRILRSRTGSARRRPGRAAR